MLSISGVAVTSCVAGGNTGSSDIPNVATLAPLADGTLTTALTMTCAVSGAYTRSNVAISWRISGSITAVTPWQAVTVPQLTLESTMVLTWLPSDDSLLHSAQRFDVSSAVDPQFAATSALSITCTRALELSVSFSAAALLSKDVLSSATITPATQTVPLGTGATLLSLLHRVTGATDTADCTVNTVSGVKVYTLFTVAPHAVSDIAVAMLRKVPAMGTQKFDISVTSLLFLSRADVITLAASGATLGLCVLSAADVSAGKTITSTPHSNGTLSLQVTDTVQTAITITCDVTEAGYLFVQAGVTVAVVTNGQPAASLVKDGSTATYPALTFTAASEVKLLPQITGLSARAVALEGNFDSSSLVMECSVSVEAVAFTSKTAVTSVATTIPSTWTDVNSNGLLYRRAFGTVTSAGIVLFYRDTTANDYTCTLKESSNNSIVYILTAFMQTPLRDLDVTVHRDLFALEQAGGTPKLVITVTPKGVVPFVSSTDLIIINGVTLTDCVYVTATTVAPGGSAVVGALARNPVAAVESTLSVTCVLSSAYNRPATTPTISASGANVEFERSPTLAALANGVLYMSTTDMAFAATDSNFPSTVIYDLTGCFSASLVSATLECDRQLEAYALIDTAHTYTQSLLTSWTNVSADVNQHAITPPVDQPHLVLQYRLGSDVASDVLAQCRLLADDGLVVTTTAIARAPLEYVATSAHRAIDNLGNNAESLDVAVSLPSALPFISATDVLTVIGDGLQISACTAPASIISSRPVLRLTAAQITTVTFSCDITSFLFGPMYLSLNITANGAEPVTLPVAVALNYPKLSFDATANIKISSDSIAEIETHTFFELERVFTEVVTDLVLTCTSTIDAVVYSTASVVTDIVRLAQPVSAVTLQAGSAGAMSLLYRRSDTTSTNACQVLTTASSLVFSSFTIPRTPATNIAVSIVRSRAGVEVTVTPTGSVPYMSSTDVFTIIGLGITSCTAVNAAALVDNSGIAFSRATAADSNAVLSVHCDSTDVGDISLTKLQLTANGVLIERALGGVPTDGIAFTDDTPAVPLLAFADGPGALSVARFAALTQEQTAFAVGQTTLVCDSELIEEVVLMQSEDVFDRTVLASAWTVNGTTHAYQLPAITSDHVGVALLYRTVAETPLARCALLAPNKFMYTTMTTVPVVSHLPVLSVLVKRVGTATTVIVTSHEAALPFISRSDLFSIQNADAASCVSADQTATGFALGAPAFTAKQPNTVMLTAECTATSASADYSGLTFATRYNGAEHIHAAGVMGVPVRVLIEDNVAPVTFNDIAGGAKAFPLTPRFLSSTVMLVCDSPVPIIGLVSTSGVITPVTLTSWDQSIVIDGLYYHPVIVSGDATGLLVATRMERTCTIYDANGATPYIPTFVPGFPLELDATVLPSRRNITVTFTPMGTFSLLEAEDEFTFSSHVHSCVPITNAKVTNGNTVTVLVPSFNPVPPVVICLYTTSSRALFDITLTTTLGGVDTTYPLLLDATPPVSFRSLARAMLPITTDPALPNIPILDFDGTAFAFNLLIWFCTKPLRPDAQFYLCTRGVNGAAPLFTAAVPQVSEDVSQGGFEYTFHVGSHTGFILLQRSNAECEIHDENGILTYVSDTMPTVQPMMDVLADMLDRRVRLTVNPTGVLPFISKDDAFKLTFSASMSATGCVS